MCCHTKHTAVCLLAPLAVRLYSSLAKWYTFQTRHKANEALNLQQYHLL